MEDRERQTDVPGGRVSTMTLKQHIFVITILLGAGCQPVQPRAENDKKTAIRIVSTAPALTELVCAVGASDLLCGRSDVCDYPPEVVVGIPIAGKFAMPSIEKVIALNPTHLLESFLVDSTQKKSLEKFNIKVEHIDCARINDIPAALRQTGKITGHAEQAEKLAIKLETGIIRLKAERGRLPAPPRALLLLDHLTPITCGANTFISEIATLAGANNIASSLKKEYSHVSMEWIIKNDPDLIVCFFELKNDPVEFFKSRGGWKNLTAVREGRVIATDNADVVCRPGPRVIEGIEELRGLLQGVSANQEHKD